MSSKELDGVIEAVRYNPEGMIEIVRLYERRGPIFSDRIIVSRNELIKRIKAGNQIAIGERKLLLAGTFNVIAPVHLVKDGEKEILVTTRNTDNQDRLEQAPLF